MSQWLTLSRAAHLIGVPRATLQKMIAEGQLPAFDGQVSAEDLTRLFPTVRLEEAGAFERITQIKEQAFGRRVRERLLPNQEVLAQRLAAQSEELEEVRRTLAHYHDLLEALREKIETLAHQSPAAQLEELARFLDEGLAGVLGREEPADQVAVMDNVLRVMAAHVRVKPSNHEFFVEGNETILSAAVRSGLSPSYGCGNGNCGLCKARIVSGQIRQVHHYDYPLSASERAQGYALLCSHTAVTDLVIEMLEAASPEDIPEQQIVAKVRSIAPLAPDVQLLHLVTPRTNRLRFLAGQRVTLSVSGQTASFRADYPIASCPCDDRNLLFHIPRDEEDEFARFLYAGALKAGDAVSVFGPWGHCVLAAESGRDHVFLACDTGFAPVKSLIEHAIAADVPGSLRLIWAATGPAGHYLENQCRAWADAIETFHYTTLAAANPEEAGTAAARQALAAGALAGIECYVAGPAAFVAAARAALTAAGLPAAQLHSEEL